LNKSRTSLAAAAGLVGLAVFAVVMALLPNGPAALEALAKLVAVPAIGLLLVAACLGHMRRE